MIIGALCRSNTSHDGFSWNSINSFVTFANLCSGFFKRTKFAICRVEKFSKFLSSLISTWFSGVSFFVKISNKIFLNLGNTEAIVSLTFWTDVGNVWYQTSGNLS